MLEQIRIVLVETTHPGNIGGAARAMMILGRARRLLVNPQYFPHAEATARASGADDLLAAAELHPTLYASRAGCCLVFGTTARGRSIPWPAVDPRGAAQRALAAAPQGPVAIVFGREHSGLSNEALARCNYLLHIPNIPKLLMRRLRRLFNRVGLDQKEINILRGILTAVQRRGRTSLREEFR